MLKFCLHFEIFQKNLKIIVDDALIIRNNTNPKKC